ncbi:MAG: hypothetical protein K6B14_07775 [Lachnospiraceae bacterium]|nr:hypothetical protein [Lachnospiraceae bacterium]
MNDKKNKNLPVIIAVLVMLGIAAVVIVSVLGVPRVPSVNLDQNYDERKEARSELQKKLLGEWQDPDNDRFVIDVWRDGDGGFHAMVNYSEQEGEVYFWEMDGSWQDNEDGFVYGGCKKSFVTYDSDGNPHEEILYEDGSGAIVLSGDDGIRWEDSKEKMGDKITFVYVGEY